MIKTDTPHIINSKSVDTALCLSGGRQLNLSVPLVMGILNVTPDSFSDGGKFIDCSRAVDHALQMEAEGAAIIDIGGESTRPGAEPAPLDVECERVLPVIERIRKKSSVLISVDTTKAEVARRAFDLGADIVNDISAGLADARMIPLVAEKNAAYVLMHMQGEPRTMQSNPIYADVVSEVYQFLSERIQNCLAAGISSEKIVVDPGIGFGKTLEHNLELLRNLKDFKALNCPLLIGVSRKSFIGNLIGRLEPTEYRLGGSIAAVLLAVGQGAKIIRAHDVAQTVSALRTYSALTDTEVGR